jgi:hypothetical protein
MIIATAFTIEPCASTTAATSPNSISEKYSGERNRSGNCARIGANAAISTVPTQPAKNEPIAATASAAPARPRSAMAWPSMQVTTDDDSPGRLTRIAVVDPPYWAP